MNDKSILKEVNYIDSQKKIIEVNIAGSNWLKMRKNIVLGRNEDTANHIFSNAINALSLFADTTEYIKNSSKILCVGKVQSGKTAFFIASIALAFDNGYKLSIVFGGTKTPLLLQTYGRLRKDFENNDYVKVFLISEIDHQKISDYIKTGYKIIIVTLKNVSSENSNLYLIENLTNNLNDIPTLIIDDESDEYTPGRKIKNIQKGSTYKVITEIISNVKITTVLFVTATPQANLLMSKLDDLSPDHITLVEAGKDYTGGNSYHDVIENKHVVVIEDSEDFISSIPDSYKISLKDFMLSCSVNSLTYRDVHFSMFIHPSRLTKYQKNIVEKINDDLEHVKSILKNKHDISFDVLCKSYKDVFEDLYEEYDMDFDVVFEKMINNLDNFRVYEYNTTQSGKIDIFQQNQDIDVKYKIYVGGDMLGRGVTINNLITTYIYRDTKISAIDTMYQRARWFGYKKEYFKTCRVYMTSELKKKFIAIADSERDLWVRISEFLEVEKNLKMFKRVFRLDNEKLILTRKTVSSTELIGKVSEGYQYDKSVEFTEDQNIQNIKLFNEFIYNYSGMLINFASDESQEHLVIREKFTEIYVFFISKYIFPKHSTFGALVFPKLLDEVKSGMLDDEISVVIMRFKKHQYRSLNMQGNAIKELPQGYNEGTNYAGDKNLEGFENKMQLQIHLVHNQKDKSDNYKIMLALSNPFTKQTYRYVTGGEYIESV